MLIKKAFEEEDDDDDKEEDDEEEVEEEEEVEGGFIEGDKIFPARAIFTAPNKNWVSSSFSSEFLLEVDESEVGIK